MADLFKEKKEKGLSILKASASSVSGEEMSKELSVSRAAVWKYIEALRKDGYEIEGISNQGYLLKSSPDLLLPMELKENLSSGYPGEIYWQRDIGSTNDEAKRLARLGTPGYSLVVAEEQAGGRGRRGRSWQSPAGGIWFSLILRPDFGISQASRISIFTAVVLAEAIALACGMKTGIKWPNDIFLGSKKVGGILIELSAELERVNFIVVGIGINANFAPDHLDPEVQETATTLLEVLGRPIDRKELLAKVANRFYEDLESALSDRYERYMIRWRELSIVLGKSVRISEGDKIFSGKAIDIAENGALIVDLDSGDRRLFDSGEVTLRLR